MVSHEPSSAVIRPQEIPATGLDRHAGIHQRQRGSADRALRRGAVGGHDVGHQPDGVGELLLGGQNRHKGALSQRTVTDLAASGRPGSLCLAGGEAGHIVVVHIALGGIVVDTVQHPSLGQGAQRGSRQHLRLDRG